MSKRQLADKGSAENNVLAKRICVENNKPTAGGAGYMEMSESIFWPDNDASFFSNAKLEELFSGQNNVVSAPFTSQTSNKFHQSQSDDSLFGDISLPSTGETAPAAPKTELSQNSAKEQNFKEINLNDLTVAEMEDIFNGGDDYSDPVVQNTQLFMDAVAFKVPKSPERPPMPATQPKEDSMSMSFISKSILDGIVQGTQYATYEALQNRSVIQAHQDLATLDQLDWQTQAFAEFETSKEAHNNGFPSKGDFYGLPDKVKKLIFEHKGIKSLYGK